MRKQQPMIGAILASLLTLTLSSCSTVTTTGPSGKSYSYNTSYESRLPAYMNTNGKKLILVDPNVHAWGAYNKQGELVRAGIATAGNDWCDDTSRPCKTTAGTFSIKSLGNGDCYSTRYPRPNGGGLMPYCMFFNGHMALHGSPDNAVIEDNVSHGCVRMRIPDAEWMRYDFANVGTKVIVRPYN